jgi:hypothetical protein
LQGVEDTVEDFLVCEVDETAERGERIADVGHVKVLALFNPRRKQVFVGDKVTEVLLNAFDSIRIIFRKGFDVLIGAALRENILDFGI